MAGATRGELNVEVSEEKGLGEESMMAFIRLHLASILQPFAERVDSLRQQLEELRESRADGDARTAAKLTEHSRSIREVRNELEMLSQEVEAAKAEAARGVALQPEIQNAQAEIAAISDRFRTVQAQSFELQHEARANTQHLTRVQGELTTLDSRMAKRLEETAQQLHSQLVALESARSASIKAVESATRSAEEAHGELRKLQASFERQTRKDEAGFAQLRSGVSALEKTTKNTDHRLSGQIDELKVAKANAAVLQTRTEQALKMQGVLDTRQKDIVGDVSRLGAHLEDLDGRMAQLNEQVGGAEELARMGDDGNIFELVRGLTQRADEAAALQTSLDQASRRQLEQIRAGEARADKLEVTQGVVKESVANLDARTVQRCLGLEALLRQQEQSRQQETARLEADGVAWKKAVNERLEAVDTELVRVADVAQKNSTGIEQTGGRLENLQGDISSTNDSVTKLRSTMDLTQEYWKGLTKGFRQTHRSVAVENELFSTRDAQAKTLPALAAKTAAAQGSPVALSARAW